MTVCRIILILLLWLPDIIRLAQSAMGNVKILTTANGLPSSTIAGIAQDRAGFIWLATANHELTWHGSLKPGYFADVVFSGRATIAGKAPVEQPFPYAVRVQHVFINGKQVLKDGEHTGVLPGRALWGPGRKEKAMATAKSK